MNPVEVKFYGNLFFVGINLEPLDVPTIIWALKMIRQQGQGQKQQQSKQREAVRDIRE